MQAEHLYTDARIHIVAVGDTVAANLTYLARYLYNHPRITHTLEKELVILYESLVEREFAACQPSIRRPPILRVYERSKQACHTDSPPRDAQLAGY